MRTLTQRYRICGKNIKLHDEIRFLKSIFVRDTLMKTNYVR